MWKKRLKRITVNLEATVITGGISYTGLVSNLSERGLCVRIDFTETATDFVPGVASDLKLQHSSGNTLNLNCEIKWLHTYKTRRAPKDKPLTHYLINTIGMEVKNPPSEYRKLLKSLK